MPYWITFADGAHGCLETPIGYEQSDPDQRRADMLALATEIKGVEATDIRSLPYPAEPRLNKQDYPGFGYEPSFCFDPLRCAGSHSCPQRYSCVE